MRKESLEQNFKKEKMESTCIGDESACFHGCCTASSFLGLTEPTTSKSTLSDSTATNTATSRYNFAKAMATSLHPNNNFTNHESLPTLEQSLSNFQKSCPQFLDTEQADRIRVQEYHHLSMSQHVCLDYIGHGLFSYFQQRIHCSFPALAASSSSSTHPTRHFNDDSIANSGASFFDIVYKSVNLDSQILYGGQDSEFESILRKRILRFMNISEDDYSMVFTANQTSAFKLLAESYPFHYNQNLLTVYDHKNEAVEAMIDSSKKKGGRLISAEFSWPNLRIQSGKLRKMVLSKKKKRQKGLFVFPLQSRITGCRYSSLWMSIAQENGWHVLLDACALGAKDMETLGLSLFQPDFLICSFYKIFGDNPSGFGCLFVKRSSALVLNKSSTNIGIVSIVPLSKPSQFLERKKNDLDVPSSSSSSYQQKSQKPELFKLIKKELSFSEIIEIDQEPTETTDIQFEKTDICLNALLECRGLDHADALGLIMISSRIRCLVNWLVNALMSLQHPNSENGLPLVRIYGPKVKFDRGPALAFNIFDWKGEKIDPKLVQKLADRKNISLGCGYLQHIWFSRAFDEERKMLLESRIMRKGKSGNKNKDKCDLGVSVISASLGFLSNFEDVYKLWEFVSRFLDADFVEKEQWRYMALNRTTVEV